MYINTRSIIFRKYLYNKHNNVRLTIFRNKNGKLIYRYSIDETWKKELENFRNERKYLCQRLIDLIFGKRAEQFEKFESK